MNEFDWTTELKAGNQLAFKMLVEEFASKVYNACLGLVQQPEDAEDITQEVFVTIFKSIHHFKGDALLSTWIYRIAVTRSLEFLRKKKRQKRFGLMMSLFNSESTEPLHSISHFEHPGVLLENKERSAILFDAVNKLPENQKTAFVLHKIEGLSYSEIANIMTVSISSVESLMFRAKQNLQKLLGDYYDKNER